MKNDNGLEIPTEFEDLKLPSPPLKNWSLVESGASLILMYKTEKKYTFKIGRSQKAKIFQLLFLNWGKRVDYETLYKYAVSKDYPVKRAKAHQHIQRQLNHLKKLLKKLPLRIETDVGGRLYISDSYNYSIQEQPYYSYDDLY